MSRILHDNQLSDKLDAFVDAFRDLVKAMATIWLASQANAQDQAEFSRRYTAETSPAQRRKLWTVAEIAEYLRVEPRTVYVWVREKDMPARKAGDELRFDPDEVERWTMRDREIEKIIEKTRIRAIR